MCTLANEININLTFINQAGPISAALSDHSLSIRLIAPQRCAPLVINVNVLVIIRLIKLINVMIKNAIYERLFKKIITTSHDAFDVIVFLNKSKGNYITTFITHSIYASVILMTAKQDEDDRHILFPARSE